MKDVIHSTSKSRSKKKRKETIASMELGKIKYWYKSNGKKHQTKYRNMQNKDRDSQIKKKITLLNIEIAGLIVVGWIKKLNLNSKRFF